MSILSLLSDIKILLTGGIPSSGSTTVVQPAHDNLNANANMQINNLDISSTNLLPVINSTSSTITVTDHTGATPIGFSISAPTVNKKWKLKQVEIHLNSAGGSGNFTITKDSGAGSTYDVVIKTVDMSSVVDYIWVIEDELIFDSDDVLNFAWANSSNKTYGITVLCAAFY